MCSARRPRRITRSTAETAGTNSQPASAGLVTSEPIFSQGERIPPCGRGESTPVASRRSACRGVRPACWVLSALQVLDGELGHLRPFARRRAVPARARARQGSMVAPRGDGAFRRGAAPFVSLGTSSGSRSRRPTGARPLVLGTIAHGSVGRRPRRPRRTNEPDEGTPAMSRARELGPALFLTFLPLFGLVRPNIRAQSP